ncbi:MAG: ABC transporter permease [Prevotella sp.]|nr:ABC transporter permease [Prevotella sp.]
MSFPFYFAHRLYSEKGDKRKVSRPVIRIAIIGIVIGIAVMIVTVSVVLGFKHTIRDKVIGFGGHIEIFNIMTHNSTTLDGVWADDSLLNELRKIEGVSHIQRYSYTQGILKTEEDFLGTLFKGIGPDYDTHFLNDHLISGSIPVFSDSTSQYQLLVSKMIADKLKLKTGDFVYAYYIGGEKVRTRKYKICGIYQTNMTRFDENLCFTDIFTTNRLNEWDPSQCTGLEISVKNFNNLKLTETEFIDKVNRSSDKKGGILTSETIYEMYPQVFNWLELLDINVWIILVLMICVSGVTMISGLLIIILERTQMIGILKALGSNNRTIRHIFLWFSVFIIVQGLLWGNIIGISIVVLQQQLGIIALDPQIYYVSEAPMELSVPLIALINISTLIICVVILIAPSYLIAHVHPAKSMRYE